MYNKLDHTIEKKEKISNQFDNNSQISKIILNFKETCQLFAFTDIVPDS
jgi:hypothetical protein